MRTTLTTRSNGSLIELNNKKLKRESKERVTLHKKILWKKIRITLPTPTVIKNPPIQTLIWKYIPFIQPMMNLLPTRMCNFSVNVNILIKEHKILSVTRDKNWIPLQKKIVLLQAPIFLMNPKITNTQASSHNLIKTLNFNPLREETLSNKKRNKEPTTTGHQIC
jgi:hypothetical protein